jgi:hypothetical protein
MMLLKMAEYAFEAQRYEKLRAEQNKFIYFLCRDGVTSAKLSGKMLQLLQCCSCCSSKQSSTKVKYYTYIYIYIYIYINIEVFSGKIRASRELQQLQHCNSERRAKARLGYAERRQSRRSQHCNSEPNSMEAHTPHRTPLRWLILKNKWLFSKNNKDLF